MFLQRVSKHLGAVTAIAGAGLAMTALPADAAVLTVGSGQSYATIQAAVNAASAGDTINVQPGTYGAVNITKSNLTIQGVGAGQPVITGTVYGGKGLIVISGTNTTIINLAFQGAVSSQGNGAGIRMQGTNLTVLNSSFRNNQDGILTDANVKSTVTVKNSIFTGNGTCVGSGGCAHGIYAGHNALLDVENSTFTNTQAGHAIKSRANDTIVMGSTIQDTDTGTSSYLIDVPNGGALTIAGNHLQKGPNSSNPTTAIAIGEEGASNPEGPMLIANNSFQNDLARTQEFVWNKSGNTSLVLLGNVLSGYATKELVGAGTIQDAPTWPGAGNPPLSVPEASTLAVFGTTLIAFGLFFGLKRKETD